MDFRTIIRVNLIHADPSATGRFPDANQSKIDECRYKMKIVIDLDNTVTISEVGKSYDEVLPQHDVVQQLHAYKELGFEIVIYTSRNMRTYEGNVGKINIITLPVILAWLEKHDVPHDEVIVGKPWCGLGGFYVDDKAVRPEEFVNLQYEQICELVGEKA